jgi:hypothetical protein
MAQATGTYSSYDAADANREDLSDMIWDVSPSETPFLSAIKKVKAKATNHEFLTDSLEDAAANAQVEGDDASPSAPTAPTRLSNYCQILRKAAVVSGTQESVDKAGRKSEMAYQLARRMKAIKKDLEWAMIDGGGTGGIGNAKAAGSDPSTAREMGSIQTYITSAVSVGATTGAAATGNGVDTMTAGTARDFTETLLTGVLQTCYTDGGDPKLLFVSPTNKGVVSGFTGGGTHYVDKDDKKLVNSVDVYIGDFHTLKVIPSRHIANELVAAIDPEYMAYAELRPVSASDLAVTGDSMRKQIIMEGTLEVCNPDAHALVADTNG